MGNMSISIDVGMAYLGNEANTGRAKGVALKVEELKMEEASFKRRAFSACNPAFDFGEGGISKEDDSFDWTFLTIADFVDESFDGINPQHSLNINEKIENDFWSWR